MLVSIPATGATTSVTGTELPKLPYRVVISVREGDKVGPGLSMLSGTYAPDARGWTGFKATLAGMEGASRRRGPGELLA